VAAQQQQLDGLAMCPICSSEHLRSGRWSAAGSRNAAMFDTELLLSHIA
jgi:hypothetical protein